MSESVHALCTLSREEWGASASEDITDRFEGRSDLDVTRHADIVTVNFPFGPLNCMAKDGYVGP
jgi:hypothetical protein